MDDLKLQVKKLWAAFARRLSGLGLGISGKYFTVKAVPDGEDAIGYTMSGSKIFISNDNEILDKLEKIEERLTFMRGVFLHELMHQIETDFVTWENVRKTVKDPVEQRIFHTIANVIEDPAIEWHARYYMRKEALKNLEFAMATTYKFGPDIDPKSTPFQQFMTALIQYGDGGLIKGTLCDEANEALCKALPVVDKAIEEDNGAKRIYLSKEVFEIARPLWEPEAANIKAMNALLEKLLREFGKAIASSSGEKINKKELKGEGESDPASEKLEKRRNITFHKVSIIATMTMMPTIRMETAVLPFRLLLRRRAERKIRNLTIPVLQAKTEKSLTVSLAKTVSQVTVMILKEMPLPISPAIQIPMTVLILTAKRMAVLRRTIRTMVLIILRNLTTRPLTVPVPELRPVKTSVLPMTKAAMLPNRMSMPQKKMSLLMKTLSFLMMRWNLSRLKSKRWKRKSKSLSAKPMSLTEKSSISPLTSRSTQAVIA